MSELCASTLHHVINGTYNGPPICDKYLMLKQITLGLEHLHKMEIIHRDLKPTNILVSILADSSSDKQPLMKLCDFGVFRIVQGDRSEHTLVKDGKSILRRAAGTKGWTAPEIYHADMSFPVDIYALGITFTISLTLGKHPFGPDRIDRLVHMESGKPMIKVVEKQLRETSPEILRLIQQMLNPNPLERPTASEVLQHAVFRTTNIKVEPGLVAAPIAPEPGIYIINSPTKNLLCFGI